MSTFTTIAGLQHLTDRELDILFRWSVTERLAGYAEGTAERREALTTVALIRRVIGQCKARKPKPGFYLRFGPHEQSVSSVFLRTKISI